MLTYRDSTLVSDSLKRELLQFAISAAVKAGGETLRFFRADAAVENKLDDGRFDPVTEADRAAEQVLRELIRKQYPSHGIFGEEFGVEAGDGLTWVIDPIDGTRAFMSGMLHWGLLLGLFNGEKPVVGVMYQPYTEEIWAGDGQSASFHRHGETRELRTRSCPTLDQAVLATTTPVLFHGREREGFQRLEGSVKLSRYGGDCYLWAMVAMGYVDLATDANLNAYDIQGLIPVIEGAGGVVTTYSGGNPSLGGTILASGSAELHEAALRVING
ncbi:MAG: histidinol-phosphatase [Pseudomonadales bacterium]